MLQEIVVMINNAILIGLLLIGIYAVLMNFRAMFFPQKIGRLIAYGDGTDRAQIVPENGFKCSKGNCSTCDVCTLTDSADGKMTFPVQVELKNKSIITADISPCCICIDRLKKGDLVGITTVGKRTVVQKVGKLHTLLNPF
ncbi:MAG TPA: hypothetical protein EYP86_04185 [Candidatus Altiarchaeales archaeon]|nr:hypothetical protein [Candidatus Altiarchaeales archaeon]